MGKGSGVKYKFAFAIYTHLTINIWIFDYQTINKLQSTHGRKRCYFLGPRSPTIN